MGNPTSEKHSRVQLGVQGRLVIPAGIRRRLGLNPGDTLVARVEGNRLIVEKAKAVRRRRKEHCRRMPEAVGRAAELIEEQPRESPEEGGA